RAAKARCRAAPLRACPAFVGAPQPVDRPIRQKDVHDPSHPLPPHPPTPQPIGPARRRGSAVARLASAAAQAPTPTLPRLRGRESAAQRWTGGGLRTELSPASGSARRSAARVPLPPPRRGA